MTVITPTIGRPGLQKLIECINKQTIKNKIYHIILWDDFKIKECPAIETFSGPRTLNLRLSDGFGKNGFAPGSPLRAIGLIAATTPWVTFADDDVIWDDDHAESVLNASSLQNLYNPHEC